MANQWVLPGVVIAVLGIVVGAMVISQETADHCGEGTAGHWHGAYSIWIDGERVQFTHPTYTSPAASTEEETQGTHVHGDDGVYHFHPRPSTLCVSWNEAFDLLGAEVTSNGITLDDTNALQGEHEGTVRVFVQEWSKQNPNWKEVDHNGLNANPDNGDAVIVLIGEYTDEEVADIQGRAPIMRGNPSYDPHLGT